MAAEVVLLICNNGYKNSRLDFKNSLKVLFILCLLRPYLPHLIVWRLRMKGLKNHTINSFSNIKNKSNLTTITIEDRTN